MTDTDECQAEFDPRSRLRIAIEEVWKEIKWQVYLLYCRFLYRHYMRWLHLHGMHWWSHVAVSDGKTLTEFDKCHWCGAIVLKSW